MRALTEGKKKRIFLDVKCNACNYEFLKIEGNIDCGCPYCGSPKVQIIKKETMTLSDTTTKHKKIEEITESIQNVIIKRAERGATDEQLIGWLEHLKNNAWKKSPSVIAVCDEFESEVRNEKKNRVEQQKNFLMMLSLNRWYFTSKEW
jgi:predicted  nucleic acid-binding Zn-ribbon protein